MSEQTQCRRLGKFFGGCRFDARYDKEPADLSGMTELSGHGSGLMLERLRRVTYVHDVCVRCGKVVRRPPHPTPGETVR